MLPTLHLRACTGCTFTVPPGTKIVKILIENCRKCSILLDKIALQTATIEIWRCTECDLSIDCFVGTQEYRHVRCAPFTGLKCDPIPFIGNHRNVASRLVRRCYDLLQGVCAPWLHGAGWHASPPRKVLG